MPIVRINEKDGKCWIVPKGIINCPKEVIARIGWPNRARIRPSYILSPLVLLFEMGQGEEEGVQLRYTSPASTKGSGATIKSTPLAKIIGLKTTLPIKGLDPIFPTNGLADLALMIEEPKWINFQLDKTNAQDLPKKTGVYEFRDSKATLRIGEGNISDRIREHLGNTALAGEVRAARYFLVNDKEESEALEHIMLCQFTERTGQLPRHNMIKA